jgi:hypothetical protein
VQLLHVPLLHCNAVTLSFTATAPARPSTCHLSSRMFLFVADVVKDVKEELAFVVGGVDPFFKGRFQALLQGARSIVDHSNVKVLLRWVNAPPRCMHRDNVDKCTTPALLTCHPVMVEGNGTLKNQGHEIERKKASPSLISLFVRCPLCPLSHEINKNAEQNVLCSLIAHKAAVTKSLPPPCHHQQPHTAAASHPWHNAMAGNHDTSTTLQPTTARANACSSDACSTPCKRRPEHTSTP